MSQITCYLCLGFRFLRPIHGRILHIKMLGKSDFIISGCSWSGSLRLGSSRAQRRSPDLSGSVRAGEHSGEDGAPWGGRLSGRNPLLPGPRGGGRSRGVSIPSGNAMCHGNARRLDSQPSCAQNTAGWRHRLGPDKLRGCFSTQECRARSLSCPLAKVQAQVMLSGASVNAHPETAY